MKVEKASALAKWGFALAVVNILFSGYQWASSQRDHRIEAALDFSKNYLKDIKPETIDQFLDAAQGKTLPPNDSRSVALLGDTMEYVSFLANNGRLDSRFLAPAFVCAIMFVSQAAEKNQFQIPTNSGTPTPDIYQFAKNHTCDFSNWKLLGQPKN